MKEEVVDLSNTHSVLVGGPFDGILAQHDSLPVVLVSEKGPGLHLYMRGVGESVKVIEGVGRARVSAYRYEGRASSAVVSL